MLCGIFTFFVCFYTKTRNACRLHRVKKARNIYCVCIWLETACSIIKTCCSFNYPQMWPFLTILWLAKSGYNEDGYIKLQKSFFSWLFYDYFWTGKIIIRTTFVSGGNITSLINFGSNSMLLMHNNGSFYTIH
jgi:hypothetical protein